VAPRPAKRDLPSLDHAGNFDRLDLAPHRKRPLLCIKGAAVFGVNRRGTEPFVEASSCGEVGRGSNAWRDSKSAESAEFTAIRVDSRKDDPTRVDVSAREPDVIGPNEIHSSAGPLTVEDALAVALARASTAHEWAVVAQLARELEARRLSAAGVRSPRDERDRYPGQQ
jgi:hypothetical protein